MTRREVITLLEKKQYDALVRLSFSERKILSILISLSYDKENPVSWRAIESIGLITKETAKTNPELVRNIAGRLLWMIRDESGGIGWSSPEILGEIVRNNPELCSDIAPIIVSFHEEKMLSAGVLKAIGRIGMINTGFIEYAVPVVLSYLNNPNPVLRGFAAWSLGEIGTAESLNELQKLINDNNVLLFYEDGELREKTVGEIAAKSIARLIDN